MLPTSYFWYSLECFFVSPCVSAVVNCVYASPAHNVLYSSSTVMTLYAIICSKRLSSDPLNQDLTV